MPVPSSHHEVVSGSEKVCDNPRAAKRSPLFPTSARFLGIDAACWAKGSGLLTLDLQERPHHAHHVARPPNRTALVASANSSQGVHPYAPVDSQTRTSKVGISVVVSTSSFWLLVAMPFVTSSFLLLVVMPGASSSFLLQVGPLCTENLRVICRLVILGTTGPRNKWYTKALHGAWREAHAWLGLLGV